jgi:predicted nucleic acid-binding Zn ribbon protein
MRRRLTGPDPPTRSRDPPAAGQRTVTPVNDASPAEVGRRRTLVRVADAHGSRRAMSSRLDSGTCRLTWPARNASGPMDPSGSGRMTVPFRHKITDG